jgi:hypothetical protein
MTWNELDWSALDRLRAGFLDGAAGRAPYWKSTDDLASYDLTYGERIGWKWDHVLRELRLRGWCPTARHVSDWGCGSGVAARRVISFFGAGQFDTLSVWDHSPLACDFAAASARRDFPALRVSSATPGTMTSAEPVGLLVVSHVLNELTPDALTGLRALIARAENVLWVEPGTHRVSRALGTLHDEVRSDFRLVAPCTHAHACPMLAPGRERDWCHFFAPPPGEIFADPQWVRFGQRAGIDLRSLPYCFLALDRRLNEPLPSGLSRVIGRPEHFKPYARLLSCDATGLSNLELPKRANPALFKQLDRTRSPLVYRWQREGDKILGGTPLPPPASSP